MPDMTMMTDQAAGAAIADTVQTGAVLSAAEGKSLICKHTAAGIVDFAAASSASLVRIAEMVAAADYVAPEPRLQMEDLYRELERRGLLEFHDEREPGTPGGLADHYTQTGRYRRILGILKEQEAETRKRRRKEC